MSGILHISNDYYFTEVYDNLLKALAGLGYKQLMYSTLKKGTTISRYFENTPYDILAPKILQKPYNLFFEKRIRTCFEYLKQNTDLQNFNLCHAHFLYADGSIALKIKQDFGIPYVVSVRNTDFRFYFRYFWHLRKQAASIIQNAEKIVFKSPGYIPVFQSNFRIPEQKIITVPNGMNEFWVKNLISEPGFLKAGSPVKFLFVGELSKNKNLPKTISLLKEIRKNIPLTFTIAGKMSDDYQKVMRLIAENKSWVNYVGHVAEKETLKDIYKAHDVFIMLSKYETFGLVYAEAMSQGLPVLYPVHQGIDGYFDEGKVGFNIDPSNLYDSRYKITFLLENYKSFSYEAITAARKLNWNVIASKKSSIYDSIIKEYTCVT